MRVHRDSRRTFWGDIFDTDFGDINVVALTPHVPIAWHRHEKQDDRLFLIGGRLRVQTIGPDGRAEHTLNPNGSRNLTIPAGIWHGYEALRRNTLVIQFNGPGKWDGSDEQRQPIGDPPWDW